MPNVVCCGCDAVNRVPAERPAAAAKCGKCGRRLFTAGPCDVTGASLAVHVARSEIPVLVDVCAPWCGPCLTMAPAYASAAKDLEPHFRLLKLNSEDEQDASARLGIRSIPTLILFTRGREAARSSGAMAAGQIVAWARQAAARNGHAP